MTPEILQVMPYIAFLVVFVGGVFAMLIGHLIKNGRKSHDKNHQFHTELMCDYCRARGTDQRRWPLRIMGDRAPKGTG
jgi:hypothetical protein